jgi:hypothetical protein
MAGRAVDEAARRHLRANTPTGEPQVVKEVLQKGIVSVPQQECQDSGDTLLRDGHGGLVDGPGWPAAKGNQVPGALGVLGEVVGPGGE